MVGKSQKAEPSYGLFAWIGAALLINFAHAGQVSLTLRDRPDISVVMDIQPNACAAAVPITIHSSKEIDFREESNILSKVMAWAQVNVSTTCPDTNAIQLRGLVNGQTIYQGIAERTNDWTLSETALGKSESSSRRTNSAASNTVDDPKGGVLVRAERGQQVNLGAVAQGQASPMSEKGAFPPPQRHATTSRPISSPDNTIAHPAERSGENKRDKNSNNQNIPTNSPAVDVSGRWTGTTLCPLGSESFTIDVKGGKGTFSYGSKKDQRSHPIEVRPMKGWEGMWIYFYPLAGSKYQGSFSTFNGLLSPNGRTMTVRAGPGLADCRGFTLTKREIPSDQPSSTVTGPPQNREPTAEEMRTAIEYSLHGDEDSLKVDNSLSGVTASIDHFEKLNCEPHKTRPGYFCDYILSANVQFRSNEGSEAGRKHAEGVQLMYEMFKGKSNAPDAVVSSRFLYVKSKNRWMKFNN
jgi:hypothetical protein